MKNIKYNFLFFIVFSVVYAIDTSLPIKKYKSLEYKYSNALWNHRPKCDLDSHLTSYYIYSTVYTVDREHYIRDL